MALMLDVDVGETIHIGSSTVTIQSKSGRKTRLRIDSAGQDVSVTSPSERPVLIQPSATLPILSRRSVTGG